MASSIHSAQTRRIFAAVRSWTAALMAPLVIVALLSPPARTQTPLQSSASTQTSSAPPAIKPDAKKAKAAYQLGIEAEKHQDWDTAYTNYSDAVNWAPNDKDYAIRRELAQKSPCSSEVDAAEADAVAGGVPTTRAGN